MANIAISHLIVSTLAPLISDFRSPFTSARSALVARAVVCSLNFPSISVMTVWVSAEYIYKVNEANYNLIASKLKDMT